nr:MAG TPA: hypothetical protein [Caudoviricetes sp.]
MFHMAAFWPHPYYMRFSQFAQVLHKSFKVFLSAKKQGQPYCYGRPCKY